MAPSRAATGSSVHASPRVRPVHAGTSRTSSAPDFAALAACCGPRLSCTAAKEPTPEVSALDTSLVVLEPGSACSRTGRHAVMIGHKPARRSGATTARGGSPSARHGARWIRTERRVGLDCLTFHARSPFFSRHNPPLLTVSCRFDTSFPGAPLHVLHCTRRQLAAEVNRQLVR